MLGFETAVKAEESLQAGLEAMQETLKTANGRQLDEADAMKYVSALFSHMFEAYRLVSDILSVEAPTEAMRERAARESQALVVVQGNLDILTEEYILGVRERKEASDAGQR